MRTVSPAALQAMLASSSGDTFIILLTISHPSLSSPIYVCSDAVACVSNGITFQPFPFLISFPTDRADQIPRCTLTIDNIDLSIVTAIRAMGIVPATVEIQVVTSGTPNTVEIAITPLTLRDVTYDALTVTGTLSFDEILAEPFPGDLVTPATLPGVFAMQTS
jgi:hypothetical protein